MDRRSHRPGQPEFRSDIEALRAIAILMVVGFHTGIPGLSGGFAGVDVFFVVSGYLITRILFHEMSRRNKIDLRNFYARRVRRLFPALALMVILTSLAATLIFAPFEQRPLAQQAFTTAAYVSNVYFAWSSTYYMGAPSEENPFLHTWSLGVEEQFYLLWPVLLLAGARMWRGDRRPDPRALLITVSALSIVSFVASACVTLWNQPWAFFLTPFRGWEFGAGAVVSLIEHRYPERAAGRVLGWIGLGGLVLSLIVIDRGTAFPGMSALIPVLSTALILRSRTTEGDGMIALILSTRPLQFLGRISYSWYLWHWPILSISYALVESIPLPARITLALISLIPAYLSFRFMEHPIRTSSRFDRRPTAVLIAGVLICALTGGITLIWRTIAIQWSSTGIQREILDLRNDLPTLDLAKCVDHDGFRECLVSSGPRTGTIVLFGDSYAYQWLPAIASIARAEAKDLIVITKNGCPPVDADPRRGLYRLIPSECDEWRVAALNRIGTIRPEITLISVYDGYVFDPTELENGLRRTIGSLSDHSVRVGILRATPSPGFDVPQMHRQARLAPLDAPPPRLQGHGSSDSAGWNGSRTADRV